MGRPIPRVAADVRRRTFRSPGALIPPRCLGGYGLPPFIARPLPRFPAVADYVRYFGLDKSGVSRILRPMKPKPLRLVMLGLAGLGFLLFVRHRSPAPADLGVQNGKLADCPESPNCVCSQAEDPAHAIAPLQMKKGLAETRADLRQVLTEMRGAKVVEESSNYLRLEFTTPLLRYVDDLELLFDPERKAIQVRSASRVGRSDLGLNRRRVEELRRRFENLK